MKRRVQEAVPIFSTKDFHFSDGCSIGKVDRIGYLEGGQETQVESIGVRERNGVSRKEDRDKGLCGFSQLQREEPNDQNKIKALQQNKKSGKKGYDPTLEACWNLYIKWTDPKGSGGRKRKNGGQSNNVHECWYDGKERSSDFPKYEVFVSCRKRFRGHV